MAGRDGLTGPDRRRKAYRRREPGDVGIGEAAAVAALERLAKRWPKTLCLVHSGSGGGALLVMRVDDGQDLCDGEVLAKVRGFNADSIA
jgi:hypothetical protein